MKQMNYIIGLFLLIGSIITLFTACEQEIDLPEIQTVDVTSKMYNQVTVTASILSDGGSGIIEQGICWNTAPYPTISNFSEEVMENETHTFSIDLKNLFPNYRYYVRAYAINSKGISYGEELTFTLWLNEPDEKLTDVDNNSYSTIRIGDQIWMKENLAVTHYRNGEQITHINMEDDDYWINNTSGAYCAYNDDLVNKVKYGYLYNGFAVVDNRGLCPDGWHIPSKEEWQKLINFLGETSTAGNLIKSIDNWDVLHPNTNNLSGFTALPGGMRVHPLPDSPYTQFWGVNEYAYFATSDEYPYFDIDYSWYVNLMNKTEWARVSDNTIKTTGQSVRCMKD